MKRLLRLHIQFFAWLGLFAVLSLHLGFVSVAAHPLAINLQPGDWNFSGDAAHPVASPCAPDLPPNVIILGLNNQNCQPGLLGGSASASFGVPPGIQPQIALIAVYCPGSTGCAQSARASGPSGELSLTVDGLEMWHASCNASGVCDPLALGQAPTVAVVVTGPSQHIIRLAVSPQTTWQIDHLEVSWRDMPQLVQGVVYSPYRDCQNPTSGPFPTDGDLYQDMNVLRNMGNTIRTYSSSGIEGQIPSIARQNGVRVSAGAWLGTDTAQNQQEINALIAVSHVVDLESVIVGSEVLSRGDLTEDQLLAYIQQVKSAVTAPVTTAEVEGTLLNHPRIMQAVDYELVDIHPYQDGVPIESAAFYVVNQYRLMQIVANGRRVIIGETGWPSSGPVNQQAIASPENQRRFLREFVSLAQQQNVEFYYLSAFDELWRAGTSGLSWGIMDAAASGQDRLNRYDIESVFVPLHDTIQLTGSNPVAPPATSVPVVGQPGIFPIYTNYGVISTDQTVSNHFFPSGLMGDRASLHVDDCAVRSGSNNWADRMIEVRYTPTALDPAGWAGVFWQQPENNWGNLPGAYDLRGSAELHFEARADQDGVRVKIMVGGSATVPGAPTGSNPSSIPNPLFPLEADSQGFVTLSTQWQEFHVDLESADLHNVIDGLGILVDRANAPQGVTIDLDNIVFDQTPLAAG